LVNRRYRAANDQVTACCAGPLEDRPFRAAVLDAISPAISLADRVDIFSRATGLTVRETDVLVELSRGNPTRRIARDLGVSEYTVQQHLAAIFTKSGTGSRAELVARACGSATT
jgi:DNA-binding CsgD family transcriptional regulator